MRKYTRKERHEGKVKNANASDLNLDAQGETLVMLGEEVMVLLEEEYGYRVWYWLPEISADELERWWATLKSVGPFFYSPVGLPGKVIQADFGFFVKLAKTGKYYRAHIHMDFDSFLITPDNISIRHSGHDREQMIGPF